MSLETQLQSAIAAQNALTQAVANAAAHPFTYSSARRYRAGDIVFMPDDSTAPSTGNWYECYHPNGSKGKDPRDATNRPDGWANTDPAAPYYWIKLGKWLDLPTIGTPVGLFKTALPQGYLKLNGTTVNASKFWRLAQVYPDLVTSGNISLPDLRAEFIRGLDDGRSVDTGRVVGSAQGDAIRNIVGNFLSVGTTAESNASANNWVTGAFRAAVKSNGMIMSSSGYRYDATFDASRVVPTAADNRPRNIALLYATRF